MAQLATNSFSAIQNIQGSLLNFTYSPNPNPARPKDFQIPQQHIDNIKNFVINANMSPNQVLNALFSNNPQKQLYRQGFDPTEFKSDGSDNENDNK